MPNVRYMTKNMDKWIGYQFEPVECRTGKDFSNFVRNLKAEISAQLCDTGCEIVSFNKGYFFVSGFIYNKEMNRYAYFYIGDARDTETWPKRVLYRASNGPKDFSYGSNRFANLENLGDDIISLLSSAHFKFAA